VGEIAETREQWIIGKVPQVLPEPACADHQYPNHQQRQVRAAARIADIARPGVR
jgi:hypothetical protein